MATTGTQRAQQRQAQKAEWIASAYAGLPFPAGPKHPLPVRRSMGPNPRHLSDRIAVNAHSVVIWTDGAREQRYHFTKGYRWGRA